MPDRPAIGAVIGLPPDETVRAFDARDQLRTTVAWSEMWHEDHARAFTIAKVAKLDLLGEIQASLADVLANGGTIEQWQAGLVPYLQKQGWWGRVADRKLTGTDEEVTIGPRRLRTIYDTNLRVSRSAGRWARIQALKDQRPFLRYTAVMDARTRPAHRAWHGTVLPVDDPWWDTHYPPCGWFCRCTVRQLSQRDLDAKGWKVTKKPPAGTPQIFYPAGSTKPVEVPAGISPGFGYNPGNASLQATAEKATRSIERAAAANLAAARAVVEELVASAAFPTFLEEPGGSFPVGVLDDQGVELLGAPSPVVVLPKGVLAKQTRRHDDIGLNDYRQLPAMLHDPLVVVDMGDSRVIYFAEREDDQLRYYKAVARTDQDQANSAIVSFHVARPREIAADIKKGRLVLDRRTS